MSDEALRERLRAVREATGLKQQDFAAAAERAARSLLGDDAPRYTQTRVSDLERGGRYVALEDIAVYASLDPDRRGKLWLAWNELQDASMAGPRLGPSIIQTPDPKITKRPKLPEKAPAKKKRA